MNNEFVFVYGSLKNGFGNNRLLESSKFISEAITVNDNFDMTSLGGFPGVVSEGQKRISGEVYSISNDILSRLDVLESNGSFYTRRQIVVFTTNQPAFKKYVVWIYILNGDCREINKDRIEYNKEFNSCNWLNCEELV